MKQGLILIDIQNEYIVKGRPYCIEGIEDSLELCKKMLAHARKNEWDIVHIQHSNQGKQGVARFLPGTTYFDFVQGFSPKNNEKHFVKTDYSCYSSPEFSNYMKDVHASNAASSFYLIGYNSVMCCLSTLEEARRRGHKFHFITDASCAKSIGGRGEQEVHAFMMDLYKEKGLGVLTTTKQLGI